MCYILIFPQFTYIAQKGSYKQSDSTIAAQRVFGIKNQLSAMLDYDHSMG